MPAPPPTPPAPQTHRILFVCLGNICRSPLFEAVFRHRTHNLPTSTSTSHSPSTTTTSPTPIFPTIDSAGTGAYHTSSPPDSRTLTTLRRHSITGYTHAARKVRLSDFDDFDWVFAMDHDNFEDLVELQTKAARRAEGQGKRVGARVVMFGAFAGGSGKGEVCEGWEDGRGEEVVDPYYGGGEGFEVAYKQAVRFTEGFLAYLHAQGGEGS